MLKALITLGPSQVSEARIADLLWPDADGDLAMQSCVTTLHRLRKMLGHHDVVFRQNNLLTVNRSLVWVDAWVFRDLMEGSAISLQKSGPDARSGKAQDVIGQAINLYKGEYLPDETWEPDAISLRERLLNIYFEGLYQLGEHALKNKNWDEARALSSTTILPGRDHINFRIPF